LQAAKIMRRFFYEAPAEIMRNYTTGTHPLLSLVNYIRLEVLRQTEGGIKADRKGGQKAEFQFYYQFYWELKFPTFYAVGLMTPLPIFCRPLNF